jgi:hypothetical protein
VVRRAIEVTGAILLFRCQNPQTAEALMACIDDLYFLSLVRRAAADCAPDTNG